MEGWRKANASTIEARLRQLMTMKGRPLVMVRDAATGKFVQFVGSLTEPLMLDLPTEQIMTAAETERAQRILGDPKRLPMGKRSSRDFVVFQSGPLEPGEAAELGVHVMERVFGSGGRQLDVSGEPP